jgi:probable F420-dependent oxidoreductase
MDGLALGPVGVALNVSDRWLDEAAELERLGYAAIWLPGGQIDRLDRFTELVSATTSVPVASAVISLDVYGPDAVADLCRRIDPGRFLVGLGGPQRPRPMRALNRFLDQLDRGRPPVPAGRRMLAALGPRKLELARERSAGAIMLLVTPAYLAGARRILGDHRALVIDQMLVLDTDPGRARTTARRSLRFLSGLPGYRQSFARMGFTGDDVAELSDRLVDHLIAWGDLEAIAARVDEHRRAGADQVVLHALSDGDQPGPIEVARAFAGKLPSVAATDRPTPRRRGRTSR